jgi:hypothetical protein
MSIIGAVNSGYGAVGFFGSPGAGQAEGSKPILNPSQSTEVQPGRKSSPAECQTCKERKYQDGSDEMVSFKSAQHISPQAAAARVRGHEAEHVSNAYKDAAMNNGKVLQASVSIRTSICPECGRTYVSGGTTATKIQYSDEKNPYQQARKSLDRQGTVGANVDLAG